MYYEPYSDNLSTFTLLKQIAQIPQNLLLARVKFLVLLLSAIPIICGLASIATTLSSLRLCCHTTAALICPSGLFFFLSTGLFFLLLKGALQAIIRYLG